MERSKRCAASTADTIAPSRADKSQSSSVTKNFRARLKKAEGPFETLTAMTCRGCSIGDDAPPSSSLPCSEECSDSVPVVAASAVDGVVGVNGPFAFSDIDSEEIPAAAASALGSVASSVSEGTGAVGVTPASDVSPPLPLSDMLLPTGMVRSSKKST